MIKAIIFDCFGVLTTDGLLPFRDKHFADKPELLEEARAHNVRVDSGLISYGDFIAWLSANTGESYTTVQRIIEGNVTNEPLFQYIRDELSPRYNIGMLSNAGENWLNRMFEPWQVALFEEIVLSFELGVVKPHPLMYETIATKLGVLPEEAVFIDDRLGFVDGAQSVGMKAIHYRDIDQLRGELEALLHA